VTLFLNSSLQGENNQISFENGHFYRHEQRWVSNFIPRFTKMFKYWRIFSVIVFGIINSAFPRSLSPCAHSRAEKTHQTIQNLRLGEVPFKISFLKNAWCHRNQRLTEQYLTEQYFTQGHGKIIALSSVFRFLKLSYLGNWEP